MSRLGAEPIFDSYWAALAMGGVLALLLLVRPQFGLVTRARQLTFLGLRLAAIGLLLLGLIRPTWITTVRTPRTSVLVMLVDGSRSMQLPSGQGSLSRWQAQGETLSRSQAALAALGPSLQGGAPFSLAAFLGAVVAAHDDADRPALCTALGARFARDAARAGGCP